MLLTSLLIAASFGNAAARLVDPPRPDHIVIVIEENKNYRDVLANQFFNDLVLKGIAVGDTTVQAASLQDMHGEYHPSQQNYLVLFSGKDHGVAGDAVEPNPFVPGLYSFDSPNLASRLIEKGLRFASFSEGLPDTDCLKPMDHDDHHFEYDCRGNKVDFPDPRGRNSPFKYVRKHCPWVNFSNVNHLGLNVAFNPDKFRSDSDFRSLPEVSVIIPSLDNDMHDKGIPEGVKWLQDNVMNYAAWAEKNNGLLIITWDESAGHHDDIHIASFLIGQMVNPGQYPGRFNHLNLLKEIDRMYGLVPCDPRGDGQPDDKLPLLPDSLWKH